MRKCICLNQDGVLSLSDSVDTSMPLVIEFRTHSYLGDNVNMNIAFDERRANNTDLEQMRCTLTCLDGLTEDVIFQFKGNLSLSENDPNSLWNKADASKEFEHFAIHIHASNERLNEAIKASQAFNAFKQYKKVSATLPLPEDIPPEMTVDAVYKAISDIINYQQRPSEIAIVDMDKNMDLYTAVMMASEKLNVPVHAEIDPSADVEEVLDMVESMNLQEYRLQTIFTPFTCIPSNNTSLRGRQKPCYAMGQYLAMKEIRNRGVNAQGIPPMSDAVAGEKYPFTFNNVEQRRDIYIDEELLERMAKARINLVRMVTYDTGTKMVLSDVRSQYNHPTDASGLDLQPTAESACYVTNRCIDILKRYMLTKMNNFLRLASTEIQQFLEGCASEGMLQPAKELGGKPFEFAIIPDPERPYDRVYFYLARGVEGYVRQVLFDGDVVTQ